MTTATNLESRKAQIALSTIGDLILHAQRGVLEDALSAYTRLLRAVGRPLSPVEPNSAVLPFTDRPREAGERAPGWEHRADSRVLVVADVLGRAIRAPEMYGAEARWREADAVFKRWAILEAEALEQRAAALQGAITDALDGGDSRQAEAFAADADRLVRKALWCRQWAEGTL